MNIFSFDKSNVLTVEQSDMTRYFPLTTHDLNTSMAAVGEGFSGVLWTEEQNTNTQLHTETKTF